jgi:hypothetical protein
MEKHETATVQFELDGRLLPPVAAKLRFTAGSWRASAALPRSATPGKVVPLYRKGATRDEAVENLVRLANYRLAFDKESYEFNRQRLATEVPARMGFLQTAG